MVTDIAAAATADAAAVATVAAAAAAVPPQRCMSFTMASKRNGSAGQHIARLCAEERSPERMGEALRGAVSLRRCVARFISNNS